MADISELSQQAITIDKKLHWACDAIYELCSSRGLKRVAKSLPHAARDLETVFFALTCLGKDVRPDLWKTRYALFLWLGMLMLNPFEISALVDGETCFIAGVVQHCIEALNDAGPVREAAAFCLSATLTRQDVPSSHLEKLVVRAAHGVEAFGRSEESVFATMGAIRALAAAYKQGDRLVLQRLAQQVFEAIRPCLQQKNSRPLKHLAIKLVARVGIAMLKPRIAPWCYSRGIRMLLLLPESHSAEEHAGLNEETKEPSLNFELEQSENLLESILDALLDGLHDVETKIRWSSAKGIGRIALRLPQSVTDDVVEAVLSVFGNLGLIDEDSAWHGSCLALAELSRLGVLLPSRLQEASSALSEAIEYDRTRGSHHIGANVRDAACYVAWAFARAYAPQIIAPYLPGLLTSILSVAIFDREVHVRRAAGAALQENIGRQGVREFGAEGITLTQTVNFFALGSRERAYFDIAPTVSRLGYFECIFSHLLHNRVHHWDVSIRLLAAKSLGKIVEGLQESGLKRQALNRAVTFLVPFASGSRELAPRHGSLIALAQVTSALDFVDNNLAATLSDVVPKLEAARLYRGRGGELVRSAACSLIEAVASQACPLAVKTQLRLLDSLDESSIHPAEAVRAAAVAGVRALTWRYFGGHSHAMTVPSERLISRTVIHYITLATEPATTNMSRGACKCLGALPMRLLTARDTTLDAVLDALAIRAMRYDTVVGEKDAETRRDALAALANIIATVGPSNLTYSRVAKLLTTLVQNACCDYGADKRGDVGSWSRIEGLKALVILSTTVNSSRFPQSESAKERLVSDFEGRALFFKGREILCSTKPFLEVHSMSRWPVGASEQVCCALMRQLGEKLDSVRNVALGLFPKFLHTAPVVPARGNVGILLFSDRESVDLPARLCACLALGRVYQGAVLSGLVISAGTSNSTVSLRFREALTQHAIEAYDRQDDQALSSLAEALLSLTRALVQATSEETIRNSLPVLKCLCALVDADSFTRFFKMIPNEPENPERFAYCLVDVISKLIATPKYSKDVPRLCAAADVLLAVFQASAASLTVVVKNSLTGLLRCLRSPYPTVCAYVAEQLYTRLLELSITDHCLLGSERLLSAQAVLGSVAWDGENADSLENAASQLASALEIERSAPQQSQPAAAHNRIKDQLDSYACLVQDAGF
mmetsp:Transcript_17802/g.55568  ORF Transcript_17802/g.55568 Transcript_17802/m.55568 type:complete len:1175 (+) Transcript_17802:28-3552(+)